MRKLITALIVSTLLAGSAFAQLKTSKSPGYDQLSLFGEAYDRIRQDAVEPVVEPKLIGAAIAGMLSGLDARSAYIDEATLRAMQKSPNDEAANLGLIVTIQGGQLKVISPQDGSPAAQAGIRPGDLIFAIDKDPTYDMTLAEAEKRLRGVPGSEVELTLRRGAAKPLKITINRQPYRLQTVSARTEGGNIGYLRIAGFDHETRAALASAVQDLRQKTGNRLIGFVLDLRNNPGGDFDAAVAVADAFIDSGDIVVVKGRNSAGLRRISATPGDLAQGIPIVVLVNGGTAREAELVAGGLQDNRRAVLLGTKTFGESSIENLIPLPGHGAIRLTTARFMTPSGRTIQGKGLDPDLTVMPLKLARLPQRDRREADLRGALKNTDAGAPSTASSLPTADIGSEMDEQLGEAADVLRGLALASARPG